MVGEYEMFQFVRMEKQEEMITVEAERCCTRSATLTGRAVANSKPKESEQPRRRFAEAPRKGGPQVSAHLAGSPNGDQAYARCTNACKTLLSLITPTFLSAPTPLRKRPLGPLQGCGRALGSFNDVHSNLTGINFTIHNESSHLITLQECRYALCSQVAELLRNSEFKNKAPQKQCNTD